jgi:o-succinylbenzoate synthase
MKIQTLEWRTYCYKLVKGLRSAQGTVRERQGIYVKCHTDDGISGFGEVAPIPGMSPETTDNCEKTLSLLSKILKSRELPDSFSDFSEWFRGFRRDHRPPPAVAFGLETALADCCAKRASVALARWLSQGSGTAVPVNYLLGRPVDDWDRILTDVEAGGYTTVKAKLGSKSVREDADFVRQMRMELGDAIAIRLDANRAWSFAEAQEALLRLNDFRPEYVEEPLDRFDVEEYARLYETTRVAIALDESIAFAQNRIDEIDSSFVQYIVMKLGAYGGISRSLDFEQAATAKGFRTVFTSGLETAVGLSAALHTAAAVPATLPPCGFATARLFKDREAAGGIAPTVNGMITLLTQPGLGVIPPGFTS